MEMHVMLNPVSVTFTPIRLRF